MTSDQSSLTVLVRLKMMDSHKYGYVTNVIAQLYGADVITMIDEYPTQGKFVWFRWLHLLVLSSVTIHGRSFIGLLSSDWVDPEIETHIRVRTDSIVFLSHHRSRFQWWISWRIFHVLLNISSRLDPYRFFIDNSSRWHIRIVHQGRLFFISWVLVWL